MPTQPYAERAKARLRAEILDAAADLVVAHGWAQARMADVAAAAGVSRQTVYNEYGSKDGLAQALVLRAAHGFLADVEQVLDAEGDAVDGVEAAVRLTLTRAADDPLLKAVLTGSGDEDLLPLLTTRAEPVLVAARDAMAARLARDHAELTAADATLVAESAVRLTVSHLVSPLAPAEVTARRLGRLVRAVVDGLPARGSTARPRTDDRTRGRRP